MDRSTIDASEKPHVTDELLPEAVLIAGLGSPQGDDRLGWIAAELVRESSSADVAVLAVRSPLDLLDRLQPALALIVIDAVRSDRPLGAIVRLGRWSHDAFRAMQGPACASTHGWGLVETLQLAQRLNREPRRIVFYGVEINPQKPARDDGPTPFSAAAPLDAPLSHAVADSLPALVRHVLNDIDRLGRDIAGTS